MKNTKKLAICSVMVALSTVIMYIGSATTVLDLSAAAVCSLFVAVIDFEFAMPSSIMVWIATSILSFLIVPTKESALIYALFGGIYPILKRFFNKIRPKVLSYATRILFLFGILTLDLFLVSKFFLLDGEVLFEYHISILYALALVVFLLYDYLLERLASLYYLKIRDKISRFLK